ncbi:DUF4271 domain-containing protein [Myroides pelagicus]|uniref:DUF4271 domain-containing protein n=1 Tax=Myroides pelagicus TaxID=270914 RepID=A0A7K1GJ96_9FLAO|nr:DUF4271 domain-containing protein [Myroides pelagicus]MEC4113055.1 DUF4271 domain-containing protein [Myroides pelagicus]MTH28942.1 DUF4271 domain-containing protein [Myroides pelagicus]
MENIVLIDRVTQNKDWATILFFISFAVLAINRTVFSVRFTEFTKLAASDKYIKIYKDNTNLRNSFTLSFLFIQLVSITFFLQIILKEFGFIYQMNLITFVQIINFVTFFVIAKYLLDKIISISFDIEEFADSLNLLKVTYRNYLGMLLLFLDILLFYNDINNRVLLLILIFTLIATNILLYIIFIKNNQKSILNKLFYFILYLCTLEIAPYFLLYFWFKSIRA